MKKAFFYLLFSLLLIQCHSTQKAMDQQKDQTEAQNGGQTAGRPDKAYIPQDPDVRVGKLPNGMTYYIRHNAKPENKAYMLLPLKVGSVVEDDDQQGLAHFMEHMNFNGTKHFKKNELIDFLQKMGVRFGADLNAFTSFDKTVYILPIPLDDSTNLDKGLLVLHDWAYFATLDDEEIEKERGVVLEEYRLGRGAEERMRRKWWPVLLKGSRYAERLPIGKKEILETFPPETLRRFHKDWYRPDLEAVIVVGDVDPDKVEAKLKEMFADIPAPVNPRERKYYSVPDHEETLVAVASDPEAAFNNVMVVYKDHGDHKPMQTAEDYRRHLQERLFAKMFNNRMDDLKDSENPPFTYGWAMHGPFVAQTKDAFVLTAYTAPEKRKYALRTLLREAKKAREFGFTQVELDRAKKELMADIEQKYQNRNTTRSRDFAWKYESHFTEQTPIPSIEWEYNMHKWYLPQITLEDVNVLGKKFIHDDNRVVVVTGLEKEGLEPVTEDDVRKIIRETDAEKLAKAAEEKQTGPLMKEKPAPGKIVKEERNDKLGTVTFYLDNGAQVTYKKTDFKKDEILMQYWKYGGKSLLSDEELKKTNYAFAAVPEAGVNGFSQKELRKILAGKKVKTKPAVDKIDTYGNGETRPKDLETMLQLTYLYFTKPNYDPKAFESWKKKQAFLINYANKPMIQFYLAFDRYMHKGDPRYMPMLPTPELLEAQDYKLTYDKFRSFFDGGTDYHYYLIGNFDENQVRDFVRTYIGGLPASGRKGQFKTYPDYTPKGQHEFVYHKGSEPKSMVIYTLEGHAPYNEKDAKLLQAFGEILTNKLIKEIRENESGVYTIRAMSGLRKLPHEKYYLNITFPCGPENARRLAQNAIKVYRDLLTNGPTDEDWQKVKKAWLVQHEQNLKENNYWLNYLSDTDYYGYDPERVLKFKDEVNAITPADIRKAANKYFGKPETEVTAFWFPENYDDQGRPLDKNDRSKNEK